VEGVYREKAVIIVLCVMRAMQIRQKKGFSHYAKNVITVSYSNVLGMWGRGGGVYKGRGRASCFRSNFYDTI
jgi:hypothetical protein